VDYERKTLPAEEKKGKSAPRGGAERVPQVRRKKGNRVHFHKVQSRRGDEERASA